MLCVKCGHQAALLSGSHSDAAMETINKLTRYCWRKICNLKLGSWGGGVVLSKCKITLLGFLQQFPLTNLLFIYYISIYSFIYLLLYSYLMISLILSHTKVHVTRFLTDIGLSENSSYPVIFKYLFIFVYSIIYIYFSLFIVLYYFFPQGER